ncbi:hypothetical protein Afil01_45510 [Actinorhabdospora filicis]|uniref:HTH tetR-type domain-containing protein n=1 Tax=Actinorhabdospora filicis TaxID=1785913 RepID=A0A9W6WAK2_9ACTN|nr:TetR/AcrR family transcriptional regulator [Actinorhabdospora filicis]GLZ79744.1 hypothetical protein Afil01_45510 [Actinorhabdospora filicis]
MAQTLRERKRERTRAAIIEAATDLIERNGYDATTVADIAAAAEIGTRTFFSYFATKEEVLFPGSDARIQRSLDAIAAREPHDRPVDVLLAALGGLGAAGADMVGRTAALRLRLTRTVPAVRGAALTRQLEAQEQIAAALREAYPEELDEVTAGALVGAFTGAITGALQALLRDGEGEPDGAEPLDPDAMRARLERAIAVALAPWKTEKAEKTGKTERGGRAEGLVGGGSGDENRTSTL